MKLKLVLLIIIVVSGGVQAQQAKPHDRSDDQPQSVINEDRGRAYIISDITQPTTPGNCTKVIGEPQQNSIFLGRGWRNAALRTREPELANLLAHITDQTQLNTLDDCGIKNLFAATSSQEKADDVPGDRITISDLEIQNLLSGMISEGSIQRPNASTIYVVFLDAETRSTLGAMISGKHYLAYHNFLNASGLKVHYVVVPFEANQKTGYQIALRAFLAAALNPNGAGS